MKTAVKLIRARCILLATAADPETYTTQRVFSTELELFVVVVLVVVVAPQDEFQFWFPNGDAPGRIVKKEKKKRQLSNKTTCATSTTTTTTVATTTAAPTSATRRMSNRGKRARQSIDLKGKRKTDKTDKQMQTNTSRQSPPKLPRPAQLGSPAAAAATTE